MELVRKAYLKGHPLNYPRLVYHHLDRGQRNVLSQVATLVILRGEVVLRE